MKKITQIVLVTSLFSALGFAGGDFEEVEPVIAVPVIEVDNSGFYVGATLAYQRVYSDDSAWFSETDSQDGLGTLGVLAGYDFNEYIAVEGRISTSVFEEDYAETTTYSIFVKPQYPVTEAFSIYALLGFGNTTVKGSDAGGDYFGFDPSRIGHTIMDESSFQWGFGVNYEVMEDVDLFVDYVSFAKDADIETTNLYWYGGVAPYPYDKLSSDALTLGVTYKF